MTLPFALVGIFTAWLLSTSFASAGVVTDADAAAFKNLNEIMLRAALDANSAAEGAQSSDEATLCFAQLSNIGMSAAANASEVGAVLEIAAVVTSTEDAARVMRLTAGDVEHWLGMAQIDRNAANRLLGGCGGNYALSQKASALLSKLDDVDHRLDDLAKRLRPFAAK
jgi:hypothetical protein